MWKGLKAISNVFIVIGFLELHIHKTKQCKDLLSFGKLKIHNMGENENKRK